MLVIELKGTGEVVMRVLPHAGSCAFSFSVSISHPERSWDAYEYPELPDCVGAFGCGEVAGGELPGKGAGAGGGVDAIFSFGIGAGLGAGGRGSGSVTSVARISGSSKASPC